MNDISAAIVDIHELVGRISRALETANANHEGNEANFTCVAAEAGRIDGLTLGVVQASKRLSNAAWRAQREAVERPKVVSRTHASK